MKWYWGLLNLGLLLAGIGFTGASVRRWIAGGACEHLPWGHPWLALGLLTLATLTMLATAIVIALRWLHDGGRS